MAQDSDRNLLHVASKIQRVPHGVERLKVEEELGLRGGDEIYPTSDLLVTKSQVLGMDIEQ